jgi:hypothetical protein
MIFMSGKRGAPLSQGEIKMYRSKVASEVVTMDEEFGFGVLDHKGREIGCRVVFWKVELIDFPPDGWLRYDLAPGFYWVMQTSSLRGGKVFGKSRNTQWFKTDLELFRAFNRYHDAAKKRAQKTAA